MKQILYAILAMILLMPFRMSAQSQSAVATSPANIVERIQEESSGEIVIDIPDDILKDILEEPAQRQSNQQRKGGQVSGRQGKVSNHGFRIQIFSDGRNQSTLRSRATARANAVCARFPKYRGQVYTFSKAPNWYARVGNFKSRDEANAALNELKRAFPAFASEMRIVQSAIVPTK